MLGCWTPIELRGQNYGLPRIKLGYGTQPANPKMEMFSYSADAAIIFFVQTKLMLVSLLVY